MQKGYIRPRYNGYLHFQDHAGQPLQDYLMDKEIRKSALKEMNQLYQQSQSHKNRKRIITDMNQLPLEGLVVLEFSQYLSGPSAGLRLADLGARVIKIERPVVAMQAESSP